MNKPHKPYEPHASPSECRTYGDTLSQLTAPSLTQMPYLGKGRWTWPLGLVHDKDLNKKITELGKKLQSDLVALSPENRPDNNAQHLWEHFKIEISNEAKLTVKKQLSKISNRIKAIKEDVQRANTTLDIDSNPDTRAHIIHLEQEIDHLEKKKYKSVYLRVQSQWHTKGERISKYWSMVVKPKHPRDIIYKLIDPGTNKITTRLSKMAEIAKNYHDGLQQIGLPQNKSQQTVEARNKTLAEIPKEQKLQDPELSPLQNPITEEQVRVALLASKCETATGMDRIPYEVWKYLHEQHVHLKKSRRTENSFNIVECMTKVFNDIQQYGVDPKTNFSLGWMCPLFKKKDHSKIENYRCVRPSYPNRATGSDLSSNHKGCPWCEKWETWPEGQAESARKGKD
ncbi:hypothetical protein BDN67DRAFT_1044848, partial [Paxillus ammoniavirescens]